MLSTRSESMSLSGMAPLIQMFLLPYMMWRAAQAAICKSASLLASRSSISSTRTSRASQGTLSVPQCSGILCVSFPSQHHLTCIFLRLACCVSAWHSCTALQKNAQDFRRLRVQDRCKSTKSLQSEQLLQQQQVHRGLRQEDFLALPLGAAQQADKRNKICYQRCQQFKCRKAVLIC